MDDLKEIADLARQHGLRPSHKRVARQPRTPAPRRSEARTWVGAIAGGLVAVLIGPWVFHRLRPSATPAPARSDSPATMVVSVSGMGGIVHARKSDSNRSLGDPPLRVFTYAAQQVELFAKPEYPQGADPTSASWRVFAAKDLRTGLPVADAEVFERFGMSQSGAVPASDREQRTVRDNPKRSGSKGAPQGRGGRASFARRAPNAQVDLTSPPRKSPAAPPPPPSAG